MIQYAISVMLKAIGKSDFNLGIRQSLAELAVAYDTHRNSIPDIVDENITITDSMRNYYQVG